MFDIATRLFEGQAIRLAAFDPEEMGKAFSGWSRDSEYWRRMDAGAVRMSSAKEATKFFTEEVEELWPAIYLFGARTLADDQWTAQNGN